MNLKFLKKDVDAIIPKYQTENASGFDLYSIESVLIKPGETHLISTGLSVELPPNTELQIRPRSGLSLKTKLRICNSPGTIDEDYRGVIKLILENLGDMTETVEKGQRIAQGVICPVFRPKIVEVQELSKTNRDSDGFGSTGFK